MFVNKIKGIEKVAQKWGLKAPQPLPLRGPCLKVIKYVVVGELGSLQTIPSLRY